MILPLRVLKRLDEELEVQGSQGSVTQGNNVSTPSSLKEHPSWTLKVLVKFVVWLPCPVGGLRSSGV